MAGWTVKRHGRTWTDTHGLWCGSGVLRGPRLEASEPAGRMPALRGCAGVAEALELECGSWFSWFICFLNHRLGVRGAERHLVSAGKRVLRRSTTGGAVQTGNPVSDPELQCETVSSVQQLWFNVVEEYNTQAICQQEIQHNEARCFKIRKSHSSSPGIGPEKHLFSGTGADRLHEGVADRAG